MLRKKKEPQLKLPKIEQLQSGTFRTRVLIGDCRNSITKDTHEECVAEYLALKHGVLEEREQEKKGDYVVTMSSDVVLKKATGSVKPMLCLR